MRIGQRGQVRRLWAPRGGTVVQPGAWERTWVSLNLAVHGGSGVVRWEWRENVTAATLASTLRRWGERGVTAVVWDRAPGHHGNADATVPVQRIEQPAYSPELNPAERVFEYLRSRIEGKTYGSLEAKKAAVEQEVQQVAADGEQIKRLTGWTWIREALAQLPIPNTVFQ
jgi:hypothetical protein